MMVFRPPDSKEQVTADILEMLMIAVVALSDLSAGYKSDDATRLLNDFKRRRMAKPGA